MQNCVKQIYSTHMKLFFTQEDFTFRTQFKVTLWRLTTLNSFTPRVSYGGIKVILTFESVDEILWHDHSNETSSAVLSHDPDGI